MLPFDPFEPFDSLEVASFIARLCRKKGHPYNNTKIQKLLYCCYGSVLAKYGLRLCEEYPRAWQYGPVFPRVFRYIQKKKGNLEEYSLGFVVNDELKSFLGKVIDVFGKHTASTLSNWTHRPGSPWDFVANGMDGEGEGLGNIIPDDRIATYFAKHVLRREAANEQTA